MKIDNGIVASAIRALRQVTEEIDSTTADTKFIKMRCEMAYKALYKAYETANQQTHKRGKHSDKIANGICCIKD